MIPASDFFAAARWWFVLLVIGLAAAPTVYRLLRWLPDRGYAFGKMLGLLLVSYLFWLLTSLGYLANNGGGILMALAALLLLALWSYRRDGSQWRRWMGENRRYVVVTELLFAAVFFFWAWVRAQNPAITGTEKPMEFAFLNAVERSGAMPPLDPWLSGFAISYYYFGYVMTSVLARLAQVAEPLAFNLGIAWLTAGAALGAFGVVYNLLAAGTGQKLKRKALALGLVAALALPLAGNMQVVLEMMHANGVGSAQFWAWLDVRDINGPPTNGGFGTDGPRFWWWWRSSRVIHEYHLSGRPEEGLEPIAEFPGFSFILGDMHPHVLALPFAFVSLGLALNWWRRRGNGPYPQEWAKRGVVGQFGLVLGQIGIPLWGLTALVLGGLSFLNTWDVLIHLFLIAGAYVLNQWRRAGTWRWEFARQGAIVVALLAIPAFLLYLPFYLGFRSQAGPPFLLPMLMRPTRLAHYLIIFGMPLAVVLILLAVLVARHKRRPWRVALLSAGAVVGALSLLILLLGWIIAVTPQGAARIMGLAGDLGLSLAPQAAEAGVMARLLWATRAIATVAPTVVAARLSWPWLTLLLASLVGLVAMLWTALFEEGQAGGLPEKPPDSPAERNPNLPFVLLLILTAALLTLGPEFVYLRDNFGQRLNTVFKFYYQAWILFGVAAVYGLGVLWRLSRGPALLATAAYGTMLAGALLFPVFAISSRAQEYSQPPTLNGMAHYRLSQPAELDALQWLRENVRGAPVIVEAVGGQYSPQGHGRVSASTGLPTLLGWAGHEFQWRGETPEPGAREAAVELIYSDGNWQETQQMLDRYGVSYVYVGPLEANTYGQHVREKFAGRLEVAYANESVIIYRWLPSDGSEA